MPPNGSTVVNGSTSTATRTRTTTTMVTSSVQFMFHAMIGVGLMTVMYYACREAYEIRLYALKEYGLIIHEFDPYFNYRATEVRNVLFVVVVVVVLPMEYFCQCDEKEGDTYLQCYYLTHIFNVQS
jgi:hypothetical protein